MKCNAAARSLLIPLALSTAIIGVNAHADALGDAIANGKANVELRYRLENVDQTGVAKEANASTLRTRLRYTTAEWESMTAQVELDNVSRIGDDRYNDTRNGKVAYPTVVDPDGADLNQALVKYSGIDKTAVTVGRQRVNLDNQRWIGSVGWRQNEQTLDGALVEYKGIDKLTATYGFVNRVNRINGPEPVAAVTAANAAEFDTEAHLVNVKYAASEALTGTGYAYLLDFDKFAAASTQTIGVRLAGKVPAGDAKLGYAVELAQQSDYANNAASFDANYMLAEVAFGQPSWEVQAGYEVLGSDGGAVAVQAPLATLHKFQGWADKFLATPNNGLVDLYVGGTLNVDGYGLALALHQFESDTGSTDYGSEIDVQVAKTFAKRYTLTLKYADYSKGDAATPQTDTAKAWLMAEAKF